ncbi:MAG: tRNA uridine-5-carboxymethylaminomethyl(34) synthesis GTPase MnmE [Pseudomonadota bacterium]
MMLINDTIAAIATPSGTGGIGIIKISGHSAARTLHQVFCPARSIHRFQSHRMYHGFIVNSEGEAIEEVLALFMAAPHTYTREDVVEIHTHAGKAALNSTLALVLKQGVRPALPGEFTLRAFLNGRIDLTQAEAVMELISARSEKSLALAAQIIKGGLCEQIKGVRQAVIEVLAQIEVLIDFPEEGEAFDTISIIAMLDDHILLPMKKLVDNYQSAQVYREGIAIIIIGRPNVGKSSLLNRLLKRERAIVTPMPGTTRDLIEEELTIKGIPVRLIDTAGFHSTEDAIETIGIRFARERLTTADIVLFVIDAAEPFAEEDMAIFTEIRPRKKIIAANKIDLPCLTSHEAISQGFPGELVVEISAKLDIGIERLMDAIHEKILEDYGKEPLDVAPNVRHKHCLDRGIKACEAAHKLLIDDNELSPALIALELQEALDALGEIIGETTPDDVLDEIFSRFCIGK